MRTATVNARHTSPTTRTAHSALIHENKRLREQLAKLGALVDHYYAAYREAGSLLARRERELADLRRQLDSRPTPLRR
jgi:hypothetical protein